MSSSTYKLKSILFVVQILQAQASEAGGEVCRGSDTPTVYVRDIDMYIQLEQSNTYYLIPIAMQTVCNTY